MASGTVASAQPGPKGSAAEASALVEKIRDLVHGNGASRDDLVTDLLECTDRRIALQLDVTLGWASATKQSAGGVDPAGSTRCKSRDDAAAAIKAAAEKAAEDELVAEAFAETLRKSPRERFLSLQDKFAIQDLPAAFHHHERCGTCGGHGEHECSGLLCAGGEVPCPRCSGDGRERCPTCSGGGSVTVQVQVRNHDGNWTWHSSRQTCGRCYGQGRSGNCVVCLGRRRVACPVCRGTQSVSCAPCQATGWFTYRHSASITGSAKRAWAFQPNAPHGFMESVKAIGFPEISGTHAKVEAMPVTARKGASRIRIECLVRHVHASMRCKGHKFSVDSIGPRAFVPLMPPFLDDLIWDVKDTIGRPTASAATASKAAASTRVTARILEEVCAGKKFDAASLAGRFSGAVSESMVKSIHAAMQIAYQRQGRHGVRVAWLAGTPLVCGVAVLSAVYDQPMKMPLGLHWVPNIASIFALWFTARLVARRRVQKNVGRQMTWRPKAGRMAMGCSDPCARSARCRNRSTSETQLGRRSLAWVDQFERASHAAERHTTSPNIAAGHTPYHAPLDWMLRIINPARRNNLSRAWLGQDHRSMTETAETASTHQRRPH